MSNRRTMGDRPMRVDGIEVSRHYVTFVEVELRLYPARKRRLAYLETCIATATPYVEEGMPKPPGVGNPTLSRAVALMQDQERAYLQNWVRLVDGILDSLDEKQRAVVKYLYFENRLKPEGVAVELDVGVATVYRLRNRALLAFCVGMLGNHVIDSTVRKTQGLNAV